MHLKLQEVIKVNVASLHCASIDSSTGLGTSGLSIKAVSEGHMIADNISTSIPFITAAVSLPPVLLGVLPSKIAFVKLKWILSWGRRSRYLATLMNKNY